MSFTCKTPKLRFPEFRGEWVEKKLGELSKNGFSNGAFNDPKKVGQGYRIINVKDMYVDGTIDVNNLTRVAIDENEFSKNKVEYGDIFFTRSSLVKEGIAYSNVNLSSDEDLTFDGHLIRMRPIKEKYSSLFLYYNFATAKSRKQFIERGKTTTMTTIGQEDIASVVILIPSKPEQEKIASFLTAVDVKIEQLTCKAKTLEKYKKSAMQKLFSQELRFTCNDGSEYPEWEEKKLGEVGQIITGKTPSTSNDDFWDGDIQFITPTDINENTKYQILTARKIVKQPNTKVLPKGSIVYTCIASIGKMAITTLPSITNQQINSIIAFENVNNEFLYYALLKLTPYIKSTQANTTLPIINKTEFSKFKIHLPSLAEQTKIANFLSAIDEKLLHVKAQTLQTQQFKKALLQQMFV